MARATGYEPLDTLKPVAPDLWIIDGPAIRFYGLPFPTRAAVVRLATGRLWVHSPTRLGEGLVGELAAAGPVADLIAPNWIHYAFLPEWQAAFPGAESWAAPGAAERAARRGVPLSVDRPLPDPDAAWADEIEHFLVEGHRLHREVVFFHRASRSLILTDLIENFEPAKCGWPLSWLVRLAGIAAPRGGMPPDMYLGFDKPALAAAVRRMIAWAPERILLAHGAIFPREGAAALQRAFARLLARYP